MTAAAVTAESAFLAGMNAANLAPFSNGQSLDWIDPRMTDPHRQNHRGWGRYSSPRRYGSVVDALRGATCGDDSNVDDDGLLCPAFQSYSGSHTASLIGTRQPPGRRDVLIRAPMAASVSSMLVGSGTLRGAV